LQCFTNKPELKEPEIAKTGNGVAVSEIQRDPSKDTYVFNCDYGGGGRDFFHGFDQCFYKAVDHGSGTDGGERRSIF
jgi:hypothetical protein